MAPATTSAPRASAVSPVRTSSGLRVMPGEDLREFHAPRPDLLIVPGGEGSRRPHPEMVGWLRAHGRQANRLVSVCTGAFLLAEAGLLDGRRVTTHWSYCGALAAKYPQVSVDPDPIFIRDGNIATSAGVTAGIDLALALVEDDLGRDAALDIARHWWCSCAVRVTRPSSVPSSPGSWPTGSRCATCSGGSPTTRPRTCRWRRWPVRPACPRGSSPGPSRPRWACRRDAMSTGSGSRRPGAVWRTPRTG